MKQYHKNPRQITGKQFTDLEKWLRELGDLSGIVHDLNTDEVVAGNQRSRVFDVNECEIVLTQEFDEPDAQGTVALGYVVWEGQRYGYRAVRWTAEQCDKANVVANRAGGEWDWDILANDFEIDDLLDWGFTEFQLGIDTDFDALAEWKGMPEFDAEGKAIRTIHVHFATPEAILAFGESINQEISESNTIWFPPRSIESYSDLRFTDES